jgi:hypothetical protein
MTIIKEGSRWSGSNDKTFRVIQIVELEGHTWIHYIDDHLPESDNREYSCYQESFEARFRPLPE